MISDSSRDRPSPALFAEAAEWLIELREGRPGADVRRSFTVWLRRSPEHIRAYMEAAALWGDIPSLAADIDASVEAIVARARSPANVTALGHTSGASAAELGSVDSPEGAHTRIARRPWALAAAIILVVTAGALFAWAHHIPGTLYATAIGEERFIDLPDGSQIELGARSGVRVHFTSAERYVDLLSGQALFTVAKNPARPFIVSAGHIRVRDVGTQFDVHEQTSGTTVTVLEGRVAIRSAATWPQAVPSDKQLEGIALHERVIYVSAGQQITLPEISGIEPPQPRRLSPEVVRTWSDHTLSFENAPLSDVIEEFNRYNSKQIVLTKANLGSLRISGVFSATEPSSLLEFLSDQMRLRVSDTRNQVLISSEKIQSTGSH
jgi:transmembrane sensor